jgi:hypothetical protein
MAVDTPATTQEKPPVDPGCLPAWDVGELPPPVPFGWKNLLALIGPGIVLVGGSLGTGEWVMGPQAAARYGGALLWVVPMAIFCQAFLNTEAMRYTLVTGEPIFTGFLRSKPGPRFWLIWYLLLDCLSWWPALAGLAAQIILFTLYGTAVGNDPVHAQRVQLVNAGILLLCALLLCFGGKVYNTLEWILSGKVFFALGYTLFATVVFVPWSVWQNCLAGMFNPFILPMKDGAPMPIDWALIAALAGYAGVGGMGNTLSSNYVREKGWGMGSKVGAIPSAFGGHHITLSHLGTMCRPTPEAQERFKKWWTHIKVDQYGIWVWGSIIGMLLPCLIGAAYLQSDYIQGKSQWEAAARMAADLGSHHGEIITKLTLLCGFIILFPGQLSSMDGIARRWCDVLWSGSRRLRELDTHNVKYVYYSFIGAYVLFGLALVSLRISPPRMMVINANMANLAVLSCMVHTLYVNTRFLPREFRPPLLKQVALLGGAVFYVVMFALVSSQTIEKAMAGTLWR